MIKFKINDSVVEAEPGWTVLETARHYGIEIPTLCYHEAVSASGSEEWKVNWVWSSASIAWIACPNS